MIRLEEKDLRTAAHQSSKGNQLKWESEGVWYKADYTGYEGLAEYVVSKLLRYSNMEENDYILYETEEILREVMERITHYYSLLKANETGIITSRYKDALYRKEGYHLYRDGTETFRARICDIEASGRLIVEDEAGKTRGYMFKEVSFLLNE